MISNQEIIDKYLGRIESKQSRASRKSSIHNFFGKDKYNYSGHIFDIKTSNLLDYFDALKKSDVCLTTKKTKWILLTSFLRWVEQYYNEKFNVHYIIPNELISWNGNHRKPLNSNKKVLADPKEIEQILQYLRDKGNFKYYIIFRLFVETGMRKGELIQIKLEEVNLEGRYINSTFGKTGEKYYFFTKDFAKWFRLYLNERKKMESNDDFLFLNNRRKPFSTRAFNLQLNQVRKVLGITKNITTHTFRRTINTLRKKVCKTPLEDRERLLGHKTGKVNIESYTIIDIEEHRKIYDANFPYPNLTL